MNYQPNTELFNTQNRNTYKVKETLPEGAAVVHDDSTDSDYYVGQQELEQKQLIPKIPEVSPSATPAPPATPEVQQLVSNPPSIVPQLPPVVPQPKPLIAGGEFEEALRIAIADDIRELGISNLREDFLQYFMEHYGHKTPEQILQEFVTLHDVQDPLTLASLQEVLLSTRGSLKKMAKAFTPIIMHLSVDHVPRAIKALAAEPEVCSVLVYSKDPGYDLVAVGTYQGIHEALDVAGVYIAQIKQQALPLAHQYSFAKTALNQLKIKASVYDEALVNFLTDYSEMSAAGAMDFLRSWKKSSQEISLGSYINSYSNCLMNASIDKDIPVEVEFVDEDEFV